MDGESVSTVLGGIPESVWAALAGAAVGSILTLIGVWLTIHYSLKHQRQQFRFESSERKKERQVNLKREVYLPAANALVEMGSTLAKMLSSDSAKDEFSGSNVAFGTAVTRIQMVASPETYKRIAEVHRAYMTTMMEMQKYRLPMVQRRSAIDLAEKRRSQYQAERLKCLELMKEYNLAGTQDAQRWRTIQKRSEFAGQQQDEAFREWSDLALLQETERLAMARNFFKRVEVTAELQAPALAAIREELEAPAATELVLEESRKTQEAVLGAMNEILPILEATLDEFRRDVLADREEASRQRTPRSETEPGPVSPASPGA